MKYFYDKKRIILVVIIASMYNVASVAFAFSLSLITDAVIDANMRSFVSFSVVAVGCLCFQIVLYLIQTVYKNRYIAHCVSMLKYKLISSICRFSHSFFSKSPVEAYQSFFVNDLKVFETQYYRQLLDMFASVSMLCISIIGICYINPVFLLAVIFIVFLATMLPLIYRKQIAVANRHYTSSAKNFLISLNEILQGFTVIKNFNVGKIFAERIASKIEETEYSYAEYENKTTKVNAVMLFVSQILILTSFAIGGYLSVSGRITTGSIIALSQLLTYTIEPITIIAGTATSLTAVKNITENCDEILNYSEQTSALCVKEEPHSIRIDSLNFGYKNTSYILRDASAYFEAPKKYAIIGENGAGKSSLLNIIAGLIDEYTGDVYIGTYNLRDISEEERNKHIAYLPQNSFVFSMSLMDNLTFFHDANNRKEQIDDLIEKFDLSKLSNADISVSAISGGEKAKIAFLRTYFKDAKIVLLDEPASAMDEKSRELFDDVIASMHDKLCLVITHRIDQSLQKYDGYVILQNNRLYVFDSIEDVMQLMKEENTEDD